MKYSELSTRAKMTAGLALLVAGVIFLSFIMSAWSLRQAGNARRAEVEPRIARLLGVQQQQEQLKQANAKAMAQLTGLAYPAKDDATLTGTRMQQDVRKVIEEAGMSVAGSRVRPAKIADGYDEISLELTVVGNMEALEKALLAIPELRPLVIIEETDIKSKRGRNMPHTATVRFRLTAVRLQS